MTSLGIWGKSNQTSNKGGPGPARRAACAAPRCHHQRLREGGAMALGAATLRPDAAPSGAQEQPAFGGGLVGGEMGAREVEPPVLGGA